MERVTVVRKILQRTSGATVAVLTGSFVSPACFAKRKDVANDTARCPFCAEEAQADIRHLFWQCKKRRAHGRPVDDLEARFGWPSNDRGLSNLEAMTLTVEDVWRHRRSAKGQWARKVFRPKGFRVKPLSSKRRRLA